MNARSTPFRIGLAAPCLFAFAPAQTLLTTELPPPPLVPVAAAPTEMVRVDLDADGDDDLVLREGNAVVFLRHVAGSLVREVPPLGVTGAAAPVVAADLDGDGHVDVAVPNWTTPLISQLRIWWGDGTGQFPTASTSNAPMPVQFGARRVAVADMDGDGDADLVVDAVNLAAVGSSLLLRNDGNRAFTLAPANDFPNLVSGDAVPFVVDVDGDGARDVVFVSRDARTRLLWNNGGVFAEATTAQFPLLQQRLTGLAVADVDGDLDPDLVLGGHLDAGVLLRTTGPRTLTPDPTPATEPFTLALSAVDLDGDSDVDLRVLRRDQDHVLHNDGTGVFTIAVRMGGCDPVHAVAELDIDDDGDRDVLRIGSVQEGPSTTVVTTSIAYTAAPGRFEYVGVQAMPLTLATVRIEETGDVDGDGFAGDTLAHVTEPFGTNPGQKLQFLTSDADGVLRYRFGDRTGGIDNGFFADLNGDGRDEYVFVGEGVPVAYLPNQGGVLGTTTIALPAPGWAPTRAGAGIDVDGDGDQDVALLIRVNSYHLLRFLRNLGGGAFVDDTAALVVGPAANGDYASPLPADLDGDGDLDLWVHTRNESQVWRNQGGVMTFVPGAIPINGYGGDYPSIADFDGDGDLDLHAGTRVLLNQGNGMFVAYANRLPNVSGIDSLRIAADLDDDGDVDLVGSGIAVWNNGNAFFSLAGNVLPFAWGTGQGVSAVIDLDRDGDPDAIGTVNGRRRVLRNGLRQLRLLGPATLGGNVALEASIASGSVPQPVFVWLACSLATVTPTFVPGLGWLQIDPTLLTAIGPFALPAGGGIASHQEPVPNDPALLGVLFAAQTLELRGNRLRLGNLVSTHLGR